MLEVKTPSAHVAPNESPWGVNAQFWARNSSAAAESAGLTAASVQQAWFPSDTTGWYWPEDHIIRTGTQTMIGMWTKVACANGQPYGQCGGEDDNIPVVTGARYSKVCRTIVNSSAVSTWDAPTCYDLRHPITSESPHEQGIVWGKSISHEVTGGVNYYYIYGYTDWNESVVLARATGQTITNYAAWEFLYPTGWKSGAVNPAPPLYATQLLSVAAFSSGHFTVDKITLDGKERYVMVQTGWGWGAWADMILVRIGKVVGTTALRAWHDLSALTRMGPGFLRSIPPEGSVA